MSLKHLLLSAALLCSVTLGGTPAFGFLEFYGRVAEVNEAKRSFSLVVYPTDRKVTVEFEKQPRFFDERENPVNRPFAELAGRWVYFIYLGEHQGVAVGKPGAPTVLTIRALRLLEEGDGRELTEAKPLIDFFVGKKMLPWAETVSARVAANRRVVDQARAEGDADAHILVGKLDIEANGDAFSVVSQDAVYAQGYFVTTCRTADAPIEFLLHGYEPLQIKPTKTDRYVENMKSPAMKKVAPEKLGKAFFKVPPEVAELPDPKSALNVSLRPGERNSAGSSYHVAAPPKIIFHALDAGRFRIDGLSPGIHYRVSCRMPDRTTRFAEILVQPGEEVDVGEMKAPRR